MKNPSRRFGPGVATGTTRSCSSWSPRLWDDAATTCRRHRAGGGRRAPPCAGRRRRARNPEAVGTNLRARGYEVDVARTGEEALQLAARHRPDVVILDLGLPGISGIDVIGGLRGWTAVTIIILSARAAEQDKVTALDAGADDYVAKPFGMNELMARLRAALRRSTPVPESALVETADFKVDLTSKQVTRLDGEVRLTPTEWGLVEVLARHPGKLVSQRDLLREVWGSEHLADTTYLRVHMARLRRKLEPDPSRPGTSSPNRAWATGS